jgi:aminopeptidase N
VPEIAPPFELVLANDDDLTFATVLPDEASLQQLLDRAAELPTATARAVAVVTVWDLLVNGRLAAAAFVKCANTVLSVETAESVIEPFVQLAIAAAPRWASDRERDSLLASIGDVCLGLVGKGASLRLVALRALARTAVTEQQLTALREASADDVDLTWRAFTRFAALDQLDPAAVAALQDRDPNPDAWVRALAAESARPLGSAKEAAWRAIMTDHSVPIGSIAELASAFWQPGQPDTVAPFAERYLDALPDLGSAGMISAMVRAQAMFPMFGVGREFVDRVVAATQTAGFSPVVRGRVLDRADQLERMLRARGE